jgi:drug/metabolite transporter (DMT)-like permease
MAIFLALMAAVAYGAADFMGGLASRKTAAVAVVILSQTAGIAVLALAWSFAPGHFYRDDIVLGIGGGIAGAIAITALYAALTIGRMGVVSPITAVIGATIPVIVGIALGERPAPLELAGVACAFVAVAFVSANADTKRISLSEPGLVLALVSGIGIGGLFVLLALGHRDAGLARVAVARATSIVLLLAYASLRRESLRPAPGSLPMILVAGALDMGANVLYVLSTRYGMLAVVAVLTALYPGSTVFLARVFLSETLSRMQWIGVGFAAAGVALIAA